MCPYRELARSTFLFPILHLKTWSWMELILLKFTQLVSDSVWILTHLFFFFSMSTMKLQYFGYLMWKADSWEKILMLEKVEGKRRRGQQRIGWFDSITDSMDINLSKLQGIVEDRGAWHAVVHRVSKSQARLRDWKTTMKTILVNSSSFSVLTLMNLIV